MPYLHFNLINESFSVCSKSEYVLFKLKELGKIAERDVLQICVQFSKLDPYNSGKITLLDVLQSHSWQKRSDVNGMNIVLAKGEKRSRSLYHTWEVSKISRCVVNDTTTSQYGCADIKSFAKWLGCAGLILQGIGFQKCKREVYDITPFYCSELYTINERKLIVIVIIIYPYPFNLGLPLRVLLFNSTKA